MKALNDEANVMIVMIALAQNIQIDVDIFDGTKKHQLIVREPIRITLKLKLLRLQIFFYFNKS